MTIDTQVIKDWLISYKKVYEKDKHNPFMAGAAIACKSILANVKHYEKIEDYKIAKNYKET
jgi:hypothetical protein